MLHVSATDWAATVGVVAVLLGLDWIVLGRRTEPIRLSVAARWSAFYVAAAAFGIVIALAARTVLIVLGAALLSAFSTVVAALVAATTLASLRVRRRRLVRESRPIHY